MVIHLTCSHLIGVWSGARIHGKANSLKKHRFSAVFFHLPLEKHRFLRFFGVFIRWSNFWAILPFTLGKSGFFAVFSHF